MDVPVVPASLLEGIQNAVVDVAKVLAGAGAAWLALRKRIGTDSSELGLLSALRTERDTYKTEWMESFRQRLKDQEEIGRLKGLTEDLQLRANELLEQEMYHQQKIGSCDEKVRGLAERVALLNIENREMFAEIARLDPVMAERISQKRWNPPSATAPEQIP